MKEESETDSNDNDNDNGDANDDYYEPESNPKVDIFTIIDTNHCKASGIMKEVVETYTFEDSTLKTSGWASSYYYMTKYLKEWFVLTIYIFT